MKIDRSNEIIRTMQENLKSNMQKHAINISILLENPMAIHDHTNFMEAVENELKSAAHYKDLLDTLQYLNEQGLI